MGAYPKWSILAEYAETLSVEEGLTVEGGDGSVGVDDGSDEVVEVATVAGVAVAWSPDGGCSDVG